MTVAQFRALISGRSTRPEGRVRIETAAGVGQRGDGAGSTRPEGRVRIETALVLGDVHDEGDAAPGPKAG